MCCFIFGTLVRATCFRDALRRHIEERFSSHRPEIALIHTNQFYVGIYFSFGSPTIFRSYLFSDNISLADTLTLHRLYVLSYCINRFGFFLFRNDSNGIFVWALRMDRMRCQKKNWYFVFNRTPTNRNRRSISSPCEFMRLKGIRMSGQNAEPIRIDGRYPLICRF